MGGGWIGVHGGEWESTIMWEYENKNPLEQNDEHLMCTRATQEVLGQELRSTI